MWPNDGVSELGSRANRGTGADDAGFRLDHGAGVDLGIGVDGVVAVLAEVLMDGLVGIDVADIEPVLSDTVSSV